MEMKFKLGDEVWCILRQKATKVIVVGRNYHDHQYHGEQRYVDCSYQVKNPEFTNHQFTCAIEADQVFASKEELIASL